MIKGGRKGRISNELVAASCAAILAVYAAGTWRTRDEDRRFGEGGEMRRPTQVPRPEVAAMPSPAKVVASAPEPALPVPVPEVEPKPVPGQAVKVEAQPPKPAKPQVAMPQSTEPAVPAPAFVVVEAKPEPLPEAAAPDDAQAVATVERRWHDGYYTGWGTSRHGDIQAFVRIEDGKIIDSGVATCETRYPCSVIDNILLQPIDLQGPDVDRVTRATESGDAYYYGLVMALQNAETGTRKSVRP